MASHPLPRGFPLALGQRLRQVRKSLGLTQREVAAKAGFGPDRISKFESGISAPNARALTHLALTLGLPVDLLLPELELPEGPDRDLYLLYRQLWLETPERRQLAASLLRSAIEPDLPSDSRGERAHAPVGD